ncbi:MAG: hypothetical protein QOG21_1520 [Actinomycetota bacterium]|jgi:hypothetical protein|nr:hypothetical protein [Actinomycetota bacterium]
MVIETASRDLLLFPLWPATLCDRIYSTAWGPSSCAQGPLPLPASRHRLCQKSDTSNHLGPTCYGMTLRDLQ